MSVAADGNAPVPSGPAWLARPASTTLPALDGCPPRPAGTGPDSEPTRSPRRTPGTLGRHAIAVRGPAGGLSFGLIHARPELFAGDREPPSCPGPGHSRLVVDGPAQSSKACEGASPPWVQIPPPPLTRGRGHVRRARSGNSMSRPGRSTCDHAAVRGYGLPWLGEPSHWPPRRG